MISSSSTPSLAVYSAVTLLLSFAVCGAEEVQNHSFEADKTSASSSITETATSQVFQGWRLFSVGEEHNFSPIAAALTNDASEGQQAVRLEATTVGPNYGFDTFNHRIAVTSDTKYICKFAAAAPEGAAIVALVIAEYDENGEFLTQEQFKFEVNGKQYEELTAEWTPSSPSTKDVNLMFQPISPGPTESAVLQLDNVRFSKK